MHRTFSCVYNGTFFEIYSFKARNTKKDQEPTPEYVYTAEYYKGGDELAAIRGLVELLFQ